MESKSTLKLVASFWLVTFAVFVWQAKTDPSQFTRFNGQFVAFLRAWETGHVESGFFTLPIFNILQAVDVGVPFHGLATYQNHPAAVAMYRSLGEVTGLEPHHLMNLSYGLVFTPPAAFIMSRQVDTRLAYPFVTIVIALQLSFGAYVAGFTLILVFLGVWAFLRSNTISNREARIFSALLALVVLALNFWWHTRVFVLLFFIISFCLVWFGSQIALKQTIDTHYFEIAFTAGLISFITLQIWDSQYVLTTLAGAGASPTTFIYAVISTLTGGSGYEVPYRFDYRSYQGGTLYYYAHLAQLFLAGILVFVGTMYLFAEQLLRRYWHEAAIRADAFEALVFAGAAGLAQLLFFVAYSATGIGYRYARHLFIVGGGGALLASRIGRRRQVWSVLVVMFIVLSLVITGVPLLTDDLGDNPRTEYRDSEPAAHYLETVPEDEVVWSNFHIRNMLMYRGLDTGMIHDHRRMTSAQFGALVGDRPAGENQGDYIVVDERTHAAGQPVHGYPNRALFVPYPASERSHRHVNRLFTDGGMSVNRFLD